MVKERKCNAENTWGISLKVVEEMYILSVLVDSLCKVAERIMDNELRIVRSGIGCEFRL